MFGEDGVRDRAMDRRSFLRLSGVGVVGLAFLGAYGSREAYAVESGALVREFESAAREYGVSPDVLMAMGYVNTRLQMPPVDANEYEKGDLHGWGSYGIMALVENPTSDTLGEASSLTGIPRERLKSDRASNIRGGAALLAKATGSSDPVEPRGFLSAVAEGAESGAVAGIGGGELYAEQVEAALDDDIPDGLKSGDASVFADPELGALEPSSAGSVTLASRGRASKPPSIWRPASSRNYSRANRPRSHRIRYIVIHVTQGSWSSAINWFQNPSAQVSAHYVIRSRDGRIAQCVADDDIAWHAGNWTYNQRSIGIEHEGYVSNKKWFTPEMFRASAKMAAYLCRRYKIPPTRKHIIGHNEVPGATHTDPGQWWWWSFYMKRVKRFYNA